MMAEESGELLLARMGMSGKEDDREMAGRGPRVAGQLVERLLRREAAEILPEAVEIDASLLFGEAPQIDVARRIVWIFQQFLLVDAEPRDVVIADIAHDADKRAVDRVLERGFDGRDLAVLGLVEIGEGILA